MNYGFLKSGTDVRGIAMSEKSSEIGLTDEAVFDITCAFVMWCLGRLNKQACELTVAVGHDSRISAQRIKNKVCEALCKSGVNVLDCSLASTPAMFMTTVDLNTDAAVQITASHHPYDRNGLKFFIRDGGLSSEDITDILDIANNGIKLIATRTGTVKKTDYMKLYAERLKDMIISSVNKGDKPLKDFHIVVDAGNGVGGFYAKSVLEPLGADISGSRYLEPDGMFPNHIPNPENEKAMESICDAVKQSHADLGVIFDTDVDRAGCVDSNGNEINRNRLIALASQIALENCENGYIVTDSVTSDGLKDFIENHLKGHHYRYRRGYKNVIDKANELCKSGVECPLAIETSGHAAFRENYFLDDGAYLMTKIVIELARGKNIEDVLAPLKMPKEAFEYRFSISDNNFKEYGEKVICEFENYIKQLKGYIIAPDNREGIRAGDKNGWFLLRLSVHDPVMPINLESNIVGGVKKYRDDIRPFFEKFENLVIPKDF